ncbi:MAG: FAD-dependent oxidoreductase [Planctomycetes bacterium]|nr:FAD-dependent oxidoreductase [Planctomycetota bacterium]
MPTFRPECKTAGTARLTGCLPSVMVWSLIFCVAAPAQEPDGMVFEANVQEVQNRTKNVTVALGHTVIITTSQPLKRVQAIDSEVAFVQSVSPQQLLVSGVGYGTTQVLVWSEAGEQNVFQITVVLDLSLLNEAIRKIDPQSDVVASPIGGHIVLSGTVSGSTPAERMVRLAELSLPPNTGDRDYTVQNHLDVSGEYQVLLRCTVAEVNRSAIRQLGINGFMAGDHARDMFVVNQLGGINPSNIGAAANALVTESIPFLTGEVGIPLSQATTLSLGFPRVQMQLFMKAMADNSLVRILAEPNLVVISGETATFLAGGEFPVPVPQATTGGTATTITIEYREFGVRLNFTPVVKAGGRIRLRVAPEVSELDFTNAVQLAGFLIPGLTQRRSETTIELGSAVQSWTSNGKTVQVRTNGERFSAARLIICAGPWSERVLTGLAIPLEVRRKVIMWHETNLPALTAASGCPVSCFDTREGFFYGFPVIDNAGMKIGEHSGGTVVDDPDHIDRAIHESDRLPIARFIERYLPGVSATPRDHAVCMYTMTPDKHFVIDTHPEYANVVFAAGFSGHGFKFAPVIGSILADLAIDRRTDHPIDFLRLSRFGA